MNFLERAGSGATKVDARSWLADEKLRASHSVNCYKCEGMAVVTYLGKLE